MNLEQLFDYLAINTWDSISSAFRHKISYGEDAITSINLLSLKNQEKYNIVIQDTRSQEFEKGCDFEFWIGNDVSGWNRFSIQAKMITSGEQYRKLGHTVRGKLQIDVLNDYSILNGLIPLYCFYNYSRKMKALSSGCPKANNIREFGCSISPLKVVKKAMNIRGARNFKWIHQQKETAPWSCLVKCPKLLMLKSPTPLKEFLNKKQDNAEILYQKEVFSPEVEERPNWVGVIETDRDYV